MAHFEIATRFSAPASSVWDYVSWLGMPRLTEGGFFSKAEFPMGTEAVPGKLRRVYGPEGAPFVEQLEEYREADFFYRYRLIDTGDLPITDYSGVVKVTPAGAGSCLKFGHTATLVDCLESEWAELWHGIENNVFEFIRKRVE